MSPDEALLAALNRTGVLTLEPLTTAASPSDNGRGRKAPAIKTQSPGLRALHELTEEYDTTAAKIAQLEGLDAKQLDAAALGGDELLTLARKQAENELEARSLRLVLESIRRRFDEAAGGLVGEERRRRRAQLDKVQPELDELANRIDAAALSLIADLRHYLDRVDKVTNQVGLTPRVDWPGAMLTNLENWAEIYNTTRAERQAAAGD